MTVNKNLPNYLCIIRIVLIPFVLLFLLDNPVVNGIPVYIRMLVSGAIFGVAGMFAMIGLGVYEVVVASGEKKTIAKLLDNEDKR